MPELDCLRILNLLAQATPKTRRDVEALLSGKREEHSTHTDPDVRTITQGEAARRLNVSRTTIFRLVREGSLATVSVRGKKRVLLSSVFAFTTAKNNG